MPGCTKVRVYVASSRWSGFCYTLVLGRDQNVLLFPYVFRGWPKNIETDRIKIQPTAEEKEKNIAKEYITLLHYFRPVLEYD